MFPVFKQKQAFHNFHRVLKALYTSMKMTAHCAFAQHWKRRPVNNIPCLRGAPFSIWNFSSKFKKWLRHRNGSQDNYSNKNWI